MQLKTKKRFNYKNKTLKIKTSKIKKLKTKNKTQNIRYESDSFGNIAVPKEHYWGATTQRSLKHFYISDEFNLIKFVHAYVIFKKCAAKVNYKLKLLSKKKLDIIVKVCNEILDNKYNDEFPIRVWQTVTVTHINMNINEVIANLCNKKLTGKLGTKKPIHPNDDVNMSQSSNDTFITAIHIYIAIITNEKLIPNLEYMINGLKKKQHEFKNIIKIGRTESQDAVPLTFGQEFSGYVSVLEDSLEQIKHSLKNIYKLAAGGTAVGTGINTHPQFGKLVAAEISSITHLPFITAPNKFAVISTHNAVLEMSDSTKVLATNLMKVANDIRWLGSGPRTGLNELILPQNEPGSSIMSGKINPTQCEAVSVVSIQVIANNVAITFSNSQGNFELNDYGPLMLYNISQSINMLSDVCVNFTKYCILGLSVNKQKIKEHLENALSLVTALNPIIGYDKATKLSHYARDKNISLREANRKLKFVSEEDFDKFLRPEKMISNS